MIWLAKLFFVGAAGFAIQGEATDKPILERSPAEWVAAPEGHWKDWDADITPPDNVQPYLITAIQAYRQGHMTGTLEALFGLLELEPDYPSALHQAGVVYFRLRRYGDAIVAFERYLHVAPHRVGDTRALAHCYYTLGRYEDAQGHYEKVLDINADSVEARRGYGLCFMRLGDSERALKELRRVLELDPSHANAATWIAQVLFDEDRVEDALEAGELARDLDPYEPRPWFLLSQIYYVLEREDDGDAAKVRFDDLNRIAQEVRAAEARLLYDPTQAGIYQRLISLHRQSGNLRAVGLTLTRWLKVEPQSMDIRVAMLALAQEMGEPNTATALADGLRKVAGDSETAWMALARFYATNRDRVKQIEAEGELARIKAAGK
jgi:Flp pilus assembly protein TadD